MFIGSTHITYFVVGIADRRRKDSSLCSEPFAAHNPYPHVLYDLGALMNGWIPVGIQEDYFCRDGEESHSNIS